MSARVLLTIDTEIMWRHHAAGLDAETLFLRSFDPAGVGIPFQLALLRRCGLKACFFVDPMPALVWGIEPVRRIVGTILDAGQEVQLHIHPNWTGADRIDRTRSSGRFELGDHSPQEQHRLIAVARDLLIEAGAPPPIAFRAGSYSANDATLDALAALGIRYDSSHNGSEHPWPSAIGLPPGQIAPLLHRGVVEIPVSLIEDTPGHLRHFQICALSLREMRAALDHAQASQHPLVTIVNHSFELANRDGTRPNRVHSGRFEGLCRLLAERRDALKTSWFADLADLPLGRVDTPLPADRMRTALRRAAQLWSNIVEERAA